MEKSQIDKLQTSLNGLDEAVDILIGEKKALEQEIELLKKACRDLMRESKQYRENWLMSRAKCEALEAREKWLWCVRGN